MKVEVIEDSEDHITEEAVEGSTTRIVPVGSVLIVVRGMILAHTLPVAVTSEPVTINQDIKALVCGERLLPDFLRMVLVGQSRLLLSLADSSAHGTKKMETEVLQQFEVPVPSLDEQCAIVEHVRLETAKLDAVRTATERTIALLKERRSALIAAAVTGQLDVGAAA
jgi:type I restriction enzyme S subunit